MSDSPCRPTRSPRAAAAALARIAAVGLFALAASSSLAACRPAAEEVAVEEEAIRATIDRYADLLSKAYAFTDASLLAPVAYQREVAAVQANVQQLADRGQRIATDLKELQIEDLGMSNLDNAYVQTFEVWEIRVMDLGSERVISVDSNQRNRVRYQLKRADGAWKVLWRQRLDDSPAADAAAGSR